jgi:serine/threonine-protein kinase
MREAGSAFRAIDRRMRDWSLLVAIGRTSTHGPIGVLAAAADICMLQHARGLRPVQRMDALGKTFPAGARAPETGVHRVTVPFGRDDAEPPAPVFTVGDVLDGTYEIRALLGEGGMGQVFDALDLHLKRRVAIKVASRPVAEEALKREAQALAAIEHRGIVAIHALRRFRGVDYLVMERVSGTSLQARLDDGPRLELDEALEVLAALTDALVAIHRAGIAHRDVKPANVMLAPGNRVVLMDFGLMVPDVHAGKPSDGFVSGSPVYMAPESIRDAVSKNRAYAVDLYALGVMAFEVLTGGPPFSTDVLSELLEAHLSKPPPLLRDRRPGLPARLSKLVDRLLAKHPDDRPESAEEVLTELLAIRARREDAPPRAAPYSVLVVDDDPLVRDIVKTIVARAVPDAVVRVASSGAEAIAQARARAPDLLVLDLQMPDMNGLEVCMFLRGEQIAERCKIVLLSGGAAAEDVALLRQLGVARYLPKSEALYERLVEVVRELRGAAS